MVSSSILTLNNLRYGFAPSILSCSVILQRESSGDYRGDEREACEQQDFPREANLQFPILPESEEERERLPEHVDDGEGEQKDHYL